MDEVSEFLVEQLPRARRALRIATITDTYPPDANDVALTVARFIEGLRQREHEIQLVRPRRDRGDTAIGAEKLEEVLTVALRIPRFPHLRFGIPSARALARLWSRSRPDVIHVVTQGPLGWSALRAARQLKVPVVSDFHPAFVNYSRRYGAGWWSRPVLAYLRKFHNRALWTLVPSETVRTELAALGFRNLRVVARDWDTGRSRNLSVRRLETLLEIAAGLGADSYAAPGERRTRAPILQST